MTEPTNGKVPKIRFKGFKGEWDQTKIESICSISTGKSNTQDRTPDGLYPFYVRSAVVERSKRYLYDEEAVLTVGDGVGTGKVFHYVNGKYDLHQRVYRMHSFTESVDAVFFFHFFSNHFYKRVMAMTAKTSVDSVRMEMIAEMDFRHSSKPEQTQIGGYFREVDRLIGLQQRKHDKLVTLKKAMLHAMFPKPGTTTPAIRFKGFEGDWEEKKLGDATTNIANNTLSRANLNYRSGLARNVHYGDVLIRFGEVLDVKSDGVPFISDDAVSLKLKSSSLENGDIVMADAAEDETVGKCTEIQNVGDQIVLAGLHTIALRPLTQFAPFYLGYYLNSDAFHDQLLSIMQGTKVLSISKTAIKQTVICFPNEKAEQQKIGQYFRTLDELISKHALQLEKLKQLKSACLERMFV